MIEVVDLNVSFGKNTVLDIASLRFNDRGFYALIGPSGCGKTTFINVLSGAISKYRGTVTINQQNLKKMNNKQKLAYRQKHVSVAYQDSVLFDDLSVIDNINIKLDFYPRLSTKRRLYQIETLLRRLKIHHLKDKLCKYLSGGEKQRVAIARTLVSGAEILVFDEPTSALDIDNSRIVFSLLSEYASTTLVLVVTHNRILIEDYAQSIVTLNYGRIQSIKHLEKRLDQQSNTITLNKQISAQPKGKTIFNLAYKLFNSRKRRNTLATLTYTFSLTAICSLLVITSSVSEGIKSSFALNYQQGTSLVEYDKREPYPFKEALTYSEAKILANKYEAKIGSFYLGNINSYFPDMTNVYLETERIKFFLDNFDLNNFNLITLIDEVNIFELYGYRKTKLHDDEIILRLPKITQRLIYEHLNLRKGTNLSRLGDYLVTNIVNVILNVNNSTWGYEDEQIFRVVAVIDGEAPGIIHSNANFATTLFEEKFQLLASYKHTVVDEFPWTLKKLHYLYTQANEYILVDQLTSDIVLAARMSQETTMLQDDILLDFDSRIVLYRKPNTYFPLGKITTNYKNEDYFYLVNNGLVTIKDALMTGFSDNFLISTSDMQIEEVISYDEKRLIGDRATLLMGANIVNGHYSLSLADGVTFQTQKKVDSGLKASNLDEIVISSTLFKKLFSAVFDREQQYQLFVSAPKNIHIENDYIIKDYVLKKITVVGVVNEDRHVIYHEPYWTILFFKDMIKIDPFVVIPTGVISNSDRITSIFSGNQDFKISHPYATFASAIEDSISQITGVIYIVAICSLLMAFVVLFLVLHTLIDDFYRHFSLLYLFGYSHKTIIKLGLFSTSFITLFGLGSGVLSTIVVELIVSRVIFSNGMMFTNPHAYFTTLLISIVGMIPAILLLIYKVKKIKIITLSKINL